MPDVRTIRHVEADAPLRVHPQIKTGDVELADRQDGGPVPWISTQGYPRFHTQLTGHLHQLSVSIAGRPLDIAGKTIKLKGTAL
ncbi:MAG: hypothetical protein V5A59_14610, partial [Bacteroidales bacterium]